MFAASTSDGPSSASESIATVEKKSEVKPEVKEEKVKVNPDILKEIEKQILLTLDDATIELPIETEELFRLVNKNASIPEMTLSVVDDLLQKFSVLMLLV